jgi:hypothetical protein
MSQTAPRPAVLLLVAIALLLRIAPIDHGMPRTYVPDTHMVRNALGMLQDKNPVPEVNRYSSYPYLVPYLLIPVYGAEYALGRVTGSWQDSAEFGQLAIRDPRLTVLPARALMALFGALTAWALWCAARQAELGPGAWAGAWLAATCLLNVQFSTQERPWAAAIFFGALCLWAAIVHERSGNLSSLLAAGAAAGLAFASHQAGAIFLALCGLAWGFAPAGAWVGPELITRLKRGAACVAVFAVVGLLVGHPYYLVHGLVQQQSVVGGALAAGDFSIGGQPIRMGLSLDSMRRLSLTLLGYDPILVVLGLVGLPMLFVRRGMRAAGWFAVIAGVFFLGNPNDHVRYLLPLCLLLALAGGVAAERLYATLGGSVLASVLLVLPLVQALRYDWVVARRDTRSMAEGRLSRLPPGSLVAIDNYGPTVDLSQVALERILELRGELRARERARLDQLKAGALPPEEAGLNAVPVGELFGPHLVTGEYVVHERLLDRGATPGDILRSLGVTHILIADRRPGRVEVRPLDTLVAQQRLLSVFTPCAGPEVPSEAFLPTEMDFPFTALWEVERPGPYLRLYDFDSAADGSK